MVTEVEYALMAGRAYQSTRAEINLFPSMVGWSEPLDKREVNNSTGFEAGYFQRGTDIVISYAGTDPSDLSGDMAANLGLATGVGSAQLRQAAEYYLQVQAANPGATITFTGHSLGGGLAALMGVFFGKQAVTFDQAPFANSAELSLKAVVRGRIPLVIKIESNSNLTCNADRSEEIEMVRFDRVGQTFHLQHRGVCQTISVLDVRRTIDDCSDADNRVVHPVHCGPTRVGFESYQPGTAVELRSNRSLQWLLGPS